MPIVGTNLTLLGHHHVFRKTASMLGISAGQADVALGAAVPTVLAGLAQSATNPGGETALGNLLAGQDDGIPDNIGNLIFKEDTASTRAGMLSGLLGGDTLGCAPRS